MVPPVIPWELDVRDLEPFTLKRLAGRFDDESATHTGLPSVVIITEHQQSYLSDGLGTTPWTQWRDIPLEVRS